VTLFVAVWIWKDLEIFAPSAGTVLLVYGFIFSLITSKLIVSSLTEMRTSIISIEAIIFLTFALLMKYLNGGKKSVYDNFICWGLVAYLSFAVFDWASDCIQTITKHLGIYCFSLEKRPKKQ
jgi:hypothetical protein